MPRLRIYLVAILFSVVLPSISYGQSAECTVAKFRQALNAIDAAELIFDHPVLIGSLGVCAGVAADAARDNQMNIFAACAFTACWFAEFSSCRDVARRAASLVFEQSSASNALSLNSC